MLLVPETDYFASQLESLHDPGDEMGIVKSLLMVRFYCSRLVNRDQTARAFLMPCKDEHGGVPLEAQGKLFANIISLVGVRRLTVGLFVAKTNRPNDLRGSEPRWKIHQLRLTDQVDSEIGELRYFE